MVRGKDTFERRLAKGNRAREVQFNRFLGNDKLTTADLIEGWSEGKAAAAEGRHILAIQDTSEINFATTARRRRGLGEIGKGNGRGVLLHPMLAVDAENGSCLGLLSGQVWTRKGRHTVSHDLRDLSDKESQRWIASALAAKPLLAKAAMVAVLGDRESDIFALYASAAEERFEVIARSMHDRKLADGTGSYAASEGMTVLDKHAVARRSRPQRAGRSNQTARLALDANEVATLAALNQNLEAQSKRLKNPHPPDNLAWAAWIIGRLGGWDGYPSSKPPGPITMKHGLEYFYAVAAGWSLKNVCMP